MVKFHVVEWSSLTVLFTLSVRGIEFPCFSALRRLLSHRLFIVLYLLHILLHI